MDEMDIDATGKETVDAVTGTTAQSMMADVVEVPQETPEVTIAVDTAATTDVAKVSDKTASDVAQLATESGSALAAEPNMKEAPLTAATAQNLNLETGSDVPMEAIVQPIVGHQATATEASVHDVDAPPLDTKTEQTTKSRQTATDSSIQEVELTPVQQNITVETVTRDVEMGSESKGVPTEPSVQEILTKPVAPMTAQTVTTGGAKAQERPKEPVAHSVAQTVTTGGTKAQVIQKEPTVHTVAQTVTTGGTKAHEIPTDPVVQTVTTGGKREHNPVSVGYETDSVEEVPVQNPGSVPRTQTDKERRASAPESPAAVQMVNLSSLDVEAEGEKNIQETQEALRDNPPAEPVSMTDVADADKAGEVADADKAVEEAEDNPVEEDNDVEAVDEVELAKAVDSGNAMSTENAIDIADDANMKTVHTTATGNTLAAVNAMSSDKAVYSADNDDDEVEIVAVNTAEANNEVNNVDPMHAEDAVDAVKAAYPLDQTASTAVTDSSASDQSSELSAETVTESCHGIGRIAAAAAASAAVSRLPTAPAEGTVVWARVKKWPWWPGVVVPFASTLFFPRRASRRRPRSGRVTVQFFCDGHIGQVQPGKIRPLEPSAGRIDYDSPQADRIQHAYASARDWADRFGPEGPLPFVARPAIGPIPGTDEEEEIRTTAVQEAVLRAELRKIQQVRTLVANEASGLRHELKVLQRQAEPVKSPEGPQNVDSPDSSGEE